MDLTHSGSCVENGPCTVKHITKAALGGGVCRSLAGIRWPWWMRIQ